MPDFADAAPGFARQQPLRLLGQLGAVAAAELPEHLLAGGRASPRSIRPLISRSWMIASPSRRAAARGFLQALARRLVVGKLGRRRAAAEPLSPGAVGADQRALAVGQRQRRARARRVERRPQQADIGALGLRRLENRRRRRRAPRRAGAARPSPAGRRGRRRRTPDRPAPRRARRPKAGPRPRTAAGRCGGACPAADGHQARRNGPAPPLAADPPAPDQDRRGNSRRAPDASAMMNRPETRAGAASDEQPGATSSPTPAPRSIRA